MGDRGAWCATAWGCRITHDLATGEAQATSRTGQCQSKGNGVGIKVKMLLDYDGRLGLRFLYTMLPFSINYVPLRFWQLRFYFLKVGQICFLFHIKMDRASIVAQLVRTLPAIRDTWV